MYRTSDYRRPPSNIDDYRRLNELVMKPPPPPPNPRLSRQSPRIESEKSDDDDDDTNQTLRKLIRNQPLNPTRSRSGSTISLKSMVINGEWKYREKDDDHLRLQSLGIENLVNICHDIMRETFELTKRKLEKRKKFIPTNTEFYPIVKLGKYEKITSNERTAFKRANIFNLMTIVYEATTTNASRSQLVRIWREIAEHNLNPRRLKKDKSQSIISYKDVFQHLIRKPNDQLLQIALHAMLINTHTPSNLRRLGRELGIDRDQFDMESIRKSTKAFRELIYILREEKLKQKDIDADRLPFKPKKKQGFYANVSGTRFKLICQAIDTAGFYISPDVDFTSNLLWNDTLISLDIVTALKPYQKINHFPTMNEISRKDLLAKNYDRVSYLHPKEYNFAPKTWILPSHYDLWYSYASNKPKNDSVAYILKPTNAATGEGIAIHCDYKQIRSMDNYIIQEYIPEPYLIDGFKFDLRIYALITSCDPLRVFIFKKGLMRMCTKKYRIPHPKNINDLSMHLTNYLIDDEDNLDLNYGKQTLKYLLNYLKEQKRDDEKLWNEIQNIVLKTIFLAEPHLLTAYRSCRSGAVPTSESVCFEILGFDILIDKNLKPWIIEVNRCPSFDVNNQVEFNIKIKLLFDTFNLLRFQRSDRKKSVEVEKIEAQQRLFANLGRKINNPIDELKENLFFLRQEKTREIFENENSGDFIRLFPINNEKQMDESMNLLTKCFEILSKNKNDLSWNTKYYLQFNEDELLNKIIEEENSRLTSKSSISPRTNRVSSSMSLNYESDNDEDKYSTNKRKKSPSRKDADSFMKRVSTQTPSNILRSTSLSSLNTPKKSSKSLATTGNITRSRDESEILPGVSATQITEKTAYKIHSPSSSENLEQDRLCSPKMRRSNDKSQVVTQSSILRETRQQQLIHQSPIVDIKKELQLTDEEITRLHQLIFEQMKKLCIHYPNKSDKETFEICTEIIENWDEYKPYLAHFWLAELDTDKRQSVIEIVWNNIHEIIKKICIIDHLIEQLPLNRNLIKLKRRLLANHGQAFWDACQNKNNSWESLFIKSTNNLSKIELNCCYCFVDLCKQSLFIVYQYSLDEKKSKQKQIYQGLPITIKS